jgi:hypothetical protein
MFSNIFRPCGYPTPPRAPGLRSESQRVAQRDLSTGTFFYYQEDMLAVRAPSTLSRGSEDAKQRENSNCLTGRDTRQDRRVETAGKITRVAPEETNDQQKEPPLEDDLAIYC